MATDVTSGGGPSNGAAIRRFIPIIITLAVGLTASFGLWAAAESWETDRALAAFEGATQDRTNSFERGIGDIVEGVNGFRGFFAGSNRIDKREYGIFARHDTVNYSSLEAMVWAPAVPAADRANYETVEAPRDLIENYRITSSAPNATEFFPVYYSEPPGNSYYSVGRDLYADPLYTAAMNAARDSAKVTVTSRIAMRDGNHGVAFISPIYKNGTSSETFADRRANLAGFNIYLINVGDLFSNALSYIQVGGIHADIVDESADGAARALHRHVSRSGVDDEFEVDEEHTAAHRIPVAGRTWSVTYTPTPEFIEARHTAQPVLILLILLTGTLSMAAVLYSVLRKGERVAHLAAELEASHAGLEQQVTERTAALTEQNAQLEEQADEIRKANESIAEQSRAIMEMSIPVIKIWDEIVMIPLIGTIDTARANDMTGRLLESIVEHGARVALLDVTGVPIIDTSVARHLIQAVDSSRILGAEVIVTGFSPDAAQTLAQLGVDFTTLRTRGNLRAGVEDAYKMVGVTIRQHQT